VAWLTQPPELCCRDLAQCSLCRRGTRRRRSSCALPSRSPASERVQRVHRAARGRAAISASALPPRRLPAHARVWVGGCTHVCSSSSGPSGTRNILCERGLIGSTPSCPSRRMNSRKYRRLRRTSTVMSPTNQSKNPTSSPSRLPRRLPKSSTPAAPVQAAQRGPGQRGWQALRSSSEAEPNWSCSRPCLVEPKTSAVLRCASSEKDGERSSKTGRQPETLHAISTGSDCFGWQPAALAAAAGWLGQG
jgi:hypothetical protein